LILSGDVAIEKPEAGAAPHSLPSLEVFFVVNVRGFLLRGAGELRINEACDLS
jgi:hypothetical protein